MIQLALRSALSDRAAEGKVVVVDEWPWETPSTKRARACLAALNLEGKVLVVLGPSDEEAYKSFRNLPDVQLLMASELNAYDILCNDWIVFTRATLPGEVVVTDKADGGTTGDRPSGPVEAGEGLAGGWPAGEAAAPADQPGGEPAASAPAAGEEEDQAGEQLAAEAPTDEELAPYEPAGEDVTDGERGAGDE
jgi:hypothetical protein